MVWKHALTRQLPCLRRRFSVTRAAICRALSHAWPVAKKEASALPIGQEVLMPGTGQMHCTCLQARDALCTSNHESQTVDTNQPL